MTKKCTKCGEIKGFDDFYKHRGGLKPSCKLCENKRGAEYRLKNRDKCIEWGRLYRKNNPEKIKAYYKKYSKENKDKIKQRRIKNKPYHDKYMKEYAKNNKEKIRNIKQKYIDSKAEDLNFALKRTLSSRVRAGIKNDGGEKSYKTIDLLGCTVEELKIHLEKQFQKGMTWENYGREGWHIDHRVPCASFDLTKESEQKACFHFTNLQPMWAKDNLSKGAKQIYLI